MTDLPMSLREEEAIVEMGFAGELPHPDGQDAEFYNELQERLRD